MTSPLLVQKITATASLSFEDLFTHPNRIYTFLNPVSYITAFYHKSVYKDYDAIFADGSILVSFIRLLYKVRIERRSFDMTSVAPRLFEYAQRTAKTIYIVASRDEEVDKAVSVFQDRYPGLRIIGYRNGYFSSDMEKEEEAHKIVELNPDFLIVGMGALMQEDFLSRAKRSGFRGIGFTCGGFIHQTSRNEIDYYPRWIDRYNLRFLYRMYREKHTRRRYLQAAFVFPIIFLRDKWTKHQYQEA